MTQVDTAGLDALGDMTKGLRDDGIVLVLARLKAPLRDRVGDLPSYPTVRAAVAGVLADTAARGSASPPGGDAGCPRRPSRPSDG